MTIDTLLFLLLQFVILIAIILFLCKSNLTFLYVFLGGLQAYRILSLASETSRTWDGGTLRPSAETMLAACLFAVLLVFISHGQDEARRAVAGLMWGTVGALGALVSSPLISTLRVSLLILLLLAAILILDTLVLVAIYSFLSTRLTRARVLLAVVVSMLTAAAVDLLLLDVSRLRVLPAGVFGVVSLLLPAALAGVTLVLAIKFPRLVDAYVEEAREFNLLEFVRLRRRYDDLRQLAIRDYLTGLYNRRHFSEMYPRELERAKRYQQPLSVAIVDIDHFKKVNDTLGHSAGDAVLKSVAGALVKYSRDFDMVFRYGGEEFLLLLPSTTKEGAQAAMEKLSNQIKKLDLSELGKRVKPVTVSVGVASCPQEALDANALIELADRRLYEAKRLGRDRIITGNEALNSPEVHPPARKSSRESRPDEPPGNAASQDRAV